MADHKVPQAYRQDPGQLVMVPDQSTVGGSSGGGARMVWIGVIIGGAFIAAACLWTVNAMLEHSVQAMVERNNSLDERVQIAERQIAVFEQRKSFFATQNERLRRLNRNLEAEVQRPPISGGGGNPTPEAPRRSVPP